MVPAGRMIGKSRAASFVITSILDVLPPAAAAPGSATGVTLHCTRIIAAVKGCALHFQAIAATGSRAIRRARRGSVSGKPFRDGAKKRVIPFAPDELETCRQALGCHERHDQ